VRNVLEHLKGGGETGREHQAGAMNGIRANGKGRGNGGPRKLRSRPRAVEKAKIKERSTLGDYPKKQ